MFRVEALDHTDLSIAEQIHRVQMAAYDQEAKLLEAVYFPPLSRTVSDIRSSREAFLGARAGEALIGAASVWPDDEGLGLNIASLVVLPNWQRRGAGRALMFELLKRFGGADLTVQTGAKNLPVLALYAECGFVELRRWLAGREPIELVKLLRRGSTRE